jgi:hypothetical protein
MSPVIVSDVIDVCRFCERLMPYTFSFHKGSCKSEGLFSFSRFEVSKQEEGSFCRLAGNELIA